MQRAVGAAYAMAGAVDMRARMARRTVQLFGPATPAHDQGCRRTATLRLSCSRARLPACLPVCAPACLGLHQVPMPGQTVVAVLAQEAASGTHSLAVQLEPVAIPPKPHVMQQEGEVRARDARAGIAMLLCWQGCSRRRLPARAACACSSRVCAGPTGRCDPPALHAARPSAGPERGGGAGRDCGQQPARQREQRGDRDGARPWQRAQPAAVHGHRCESRSRP
jgi:hypothetical protein